MSKSINNTDPLLRAIADGDPHCPDGQALVALGQLIRTHSQIPQKTGDMSDDVLARLRDTDQESANAIDAYYNQGLNEPTPERCADLARFADLVRNIGPQRVDLTASVLRRISASARFTAYANEERNGLDGRARWRIWSAVIAGHVAALLALAIFELGYYTGTADTADKTTPINGVSATANGEPGDINSGNNSVGDASAVRLNAGQPDLHFSAPALPPNLPKAWGDIRGLGTDLFLMRRFPELRDNARALYGMSASGPAVVHSITWLRSQLNRTTGAFVPVAGNDEHDLATHSLATLALLGEGLGDKSLSIDTRKAIDWLRVRLGDTELVGDGSGADRVLSSVSQVTSGLMCLTLVEGSLLYGDLGLRTVAESCLSTIDSGLPMQPGAAGLGGFTLLALETAQQAGMHVPGRLLAQARRTIARSLPTVDDDAGRVGLAAFARSIYGLGSNDSTTQQIKQLRQLIPGTTSGRADPLGWFFATLAMREASEADWQQWSHALEEQLVPLIGSSGENNGRVSAQSIRYGETGGDVFATSLVVLNLQAPYRYLPLAPTAK
jgi:hypothetical protein